MTNTPVSHAHDTPGSRSVPVSSRRGKAHPDEGSEVRVRRAGPAGGAPPGAAG